MIIIKELKKHRIYLILFSCLLIFVTIFIGVSLISNSKYSPIPSSISSKASFSIFYPAPNVHGLSPQKSSLNYSRANDGLSYVVNVNNKKVIVSEENTPEIFAQSGVYDYKLQQANEYNSFKTSAGEVDLTKPTGLSGQTVAWVNSKNTFILATATQSLSQSDWNLLFNNMIIYN